MSLCSTSTPGTHCPCDSFVHPAPLDIAAGLTQLPRQVAGFPEFRRAMLRAISEYGPLTGWQARKDEDLGVMLIEMWAYVCDVLAFYDGVISHEAYLRTARLRPSVRKLVDLLGYIPRPATGALASLAAIASGRQPVHLTQGVAFKSGAFDTEPPQTFELDADTVIHPFANRWELRRVPLLTVGTHNPSSLTVLPLGDLPQGTLVLVVNTGGGTPLTAATVTANASFTGDDGQVYSQLSLSTGTGITSNTQLTSVSLLKHNLTAKLWSRGLVSDAFSTQPSNHTVHLSMDRQYDQLRAGDYVTVQLGSTYRPARIHSVADVEKVASTGSAISINSNTFSLPSVKVPVTQLTLQNQALYTSLQGFTAIGTVQVHFDMVPAARVVREPAKTLVANNPLKFTAPVEQPLGTFAPTEFILEDNNTLGQWLEGGLNVAQNGLDIPDQSAWTQTLYAPVKAYGNILHVSRGETVSREVLGNGNASVASQQFTLKKKPLTYFLSPTLDNDQGVKSTLEVYVEGIRWTEVASFYGTGPDDEVYVVRQTDEGDSVLTFGDGKRGRRLPTGSKNVIANYRFGAGAATPPAGSINQIGKPATGLQSVANPVAATAGADAEAQEDIRGNAPQSILILGRAVSMKDMEAVAISVPGVRLAQAEWRWSATAQRPTAHIWYVGDAGLESSITMRLRNVTEASTPFDVHVATPRSISLYIGVGYDPRYDPESLTAAIHSVLMEAETGFLMPENLGIGQHFFRSQLYAAVLAVEGTTSIQSLLWANAAGNPTPFSTYGKQQYAGHYWDFETYPPVITLSEESV